MAMTRDDIIRMAQEAGATRDHPEMLPNFWTLTNPDLERFANLVAAAEREECAKVCEEAHWSLDDRNEYAVAIRARGNNGL